MNYKKIYNSIINNAQKSNRLKIKNGTYYEKHHILPRCLNGSNDIINIVLLTAKEHFLCHKLLKEIYPENKSLIYAFWRMCITGQKERHKPSALIYERIRTEFSKFQSSQKVGKRLSEEHKQKIGNAHKGMKHPNMKRPTKDTIEKRRQGIIESYKSDERREKHKHAIQEYHKNNPAPKGENAHFFGKKHRIESKQKASIKRKQMFSEGYIHPRSVKVLNKITGQIYNNMKSAWLDLFPNYSYNYFQMMLKDKKTNKTNCKIMQNG